MDARMNICASVEHNRKILQQCGGLAIVFSRSGHGCSGSSYQSPAECPRLRGATIEGADLDFAFVLL